MEEDIKILEQLIEDYEMCREIVCVKDIEAIKNLINRVKELEKIVEAYNVIPNDYIPKDMKIVIADREYFANGILKETCIPKSKIKAKIEEVKNRKENFVFERVTSEDIRRTIITNLEELLEEQEDK